MKLYGYTRTQSLEILTQLAERGLRPADADERGFPTPVGVTYPETGEVEHYVWATDAPLPEWRHEDD